MREGTAALRDAEFAARRDPTDDLEDTRYATHAARDARADERDRAADERERIAAERGVRAGDRADRAHLRDVASGARGPEADQREIDAETTPV